MNILEEIIRRKSNTYNLYSTVCHLLQDDITYERLSRQELFKSFQNPITQKRCPYLLKAQDPTSYEHAVLRQLHPFLVDFTRENLQIFPQPLQNSKQAYLFTHLENAYDIRLQIINLTALNRLPKTYFAIRHQTDAFSHIALVVEDNNGCIIYTGEDPTTATEEQTHSTLAEPICMTENGHRILLRSYSSKGNNDYVFGCIDEKPIRIRDQELWVGTETIPLNLATLAFKKDEKDIARYLLRTYATYHQKKEADHGNH